MENSQFSQTQNSRAKSKIESLIEKNYEYEKILQEKDNKIFDLKMKNSKLLTQLHGSKEVEKVQGMNVSALKNMMKKIENFEGNIVTKLKVQDKSFDRLGTKFQKILNKYKLGLRKNKRKLSKAMEDLENYETRMDVLIKDNLRLKSEILKIQRKNDKVLVEKENSISVNESYYREVADVNLKKLDKAMDLVKIKGKKF
jgi:succinate dehydrogenase flavin-adding protein (antitoxin of CptAB toxin-antitoxin module)